MLTYALIHSIWQFTVVGVLCWLSQKLIPVQHARLRHNIVLALLYLMPVMFVLTCIHFAPVGMIQPKEALSVIRADIIAPTVTFAWVLGVILGLTKLGFSWRTLHQLAEERNSVSPTDIEAFVQNLTLRMGISRPIDIRLSDIVTGPCTFAFWKPIILIPASCVARLSVEELEAVIAHELAHIMRFDSLHRTIQTILEAIFFYHPIMPYVSRQVSLEREHDCDDLALTAINDPKPLATGLLKAGFGSIDNAFILGARTREMAALENRISRIVSLSGSKLSPNQISARLAISALILSIVASTSFFTALTWADKTNATKFTRPMLVNLKDAACDQIKEASLYDDPKFYQGGPATLNFSNDMVSMNDVALPPKTQAALMDVIQEYRLAEYREVKLRYWGDSIKLVLISEQGDHDEAPYVFRTKPDSNHVDAFRLSANS